MKARRATSRHGPLLVAAILVAAATGCGGDEGTDQAAPEQQAAGATEATTTTTTTQPDASDEEAVRPFIEELLAQWDDHMSAVLVDPGQVVDTPDHPLAEEMAESFTEDSPFMTDLTELLRQVYIAQDFGVRPGPAGLSQHTTLLYFTQTEPPDFVSFVFCSYHDGEDYELSSGEPHPPTIGVTDGAGDAVWVDGEWRLHRLQQLGWHTEPEDTPNPCPDLIPTAMEGR